MAALEEPEQDKTEGDTDLSRHNAEPSASPRNESFLPEIAQKSDYIQLAKAGGHKGTIIILLVWVCLMLHCRSFNTSSFCSR